MCKSIALGIACLTLAFSGYCRASIISVDNGKGGKHDFSCKTEDKGNSCKVDFKSDKCDKGDKGGKDCITPVLDDSSNLNLDKCDKDLKDCKGDKDGKDNCKIDFRKHDHEPSYCDNGGKDDGCGDHQLNCGNYAPSCPEGGHTCTCASVPAPAASAMGGIGLAGIMLMSWLRTRRSIIA
ncbi:MAG: hypothetical protein ABSB42_19535 [Tepidisphaeraceae bacterium]|jgi:hypothetical protein